LDAQGSLGTTYTAYKWIFIGAGSSDIPNRDQEIKGVITHEICHYVLKMIFENRENPYYAGDKETEKYFDDIVDACSQLTNDEPEVKRRRIDVGDDEVITSVYACYDKADFTAELIVRVPHILAQFHHDEEKIAYFEEKYELLFEFYKKFVVPELEIFNLRQRIIVRNFNKNAEVLENIKELKYEFLALKNMYYLTEKKSLIITTNIPKLLLLNIFAYLFNNIRGLVEANNVFVSSKALRRSVFLTDLEEAFEENPNLKVFMLYTESLYENFQQFIRNYASNFVFILHDESLVDEVKQFLCTNNLNSLEVTENYKFIDLSHDTRKDLLQTKINFQNNSLPIVNVISHKNEVLDQDEEFTNGLNDLFNDQLLNMLIDKTEIILNKKPESNDNNYFSILFRPRNFIKVENSKIYRQSDDDNRSKATPQISKLLNQEFLRDIKNKNFVLISDVAGNGKSWTLRNMEKILVETNPNRWITCTDLKQYTKAFKRKQSIKFEEFIIKIVLKLKDEIEIKLFSHFYKVGKVTILVDGFDEIAPDYASYVLSLIKTFEYNDGNQLWLTSRDYFEVDLSDEFQINTVYKLDHFTKEESADMIVNSWILHEFEDENKSLKEFDLEAIKSSSNYITYQKIANDLITKILHKDKASIGYPLFYKMIADIFKNRKDTIFEITILEVYRECIEIQYARWCFEKGELGKKAIIKSLNTSLNFLGIHQYFALKSIFPDSSSFCDLQFKINEWSNEEIINCGILYEMDGLFLFVHETFREYFAVDFVIKNLLKSEKYIDENFCNIFMQFLTERRFGVIRMFLNEALEMNSVSTEINQKLPILAEYIYKNVNKFINLSDIFDNNLEKLSLLIISIMKYGNFDEAQIIFQNNQIITSIVKNTGLFIEFQEFILSKINNENVKLFIVNHKILFEIAGSQLDATIIEYFIKNIAKKIHAREFSDMIQSTDENGNTLLFSLIQTNHEFSEKLNAFFEIIQKFLLPFEIVDFIKKINRNGENIFFKCISLKNTNKLKCLWKAIEIISVRLNSSELFKDLFNQKSLNHEPFLHIAAYCDSIDFHKTLFELLSETFQYGKELQLLLLEEHNRNNMLHILNTNKAEVFEFMLQFLKNNFSESFYLQNLRSKGNYGRNLILASARVSNDSKILQIVINSFRSSCKSIEEFLNDIIECDDEGSNVLYLAACNINKDVFEFIIGEVETIISSEKIKNLFINVGYGKRNLLQAAAFQNESLEFHEMLWIITRKYFDSSEVLKIAKNFDNYGYNLILNATMRNTKDVIELTWNEIKEDLKNRISENEKIIIGIENCDIIINNILSSINVTKEQEDLLKLKWIEAESSTMDNKYKLVFKLKSVINNLENLMFFITDENIENHKIFWTHLLNTYKNCKELNNILNFKDTSGHNFIFILIINCKMDILEFTFKQLKENLCGTHYQEILAQNGCNERSLLQSAVISLEDKEYKFLWHKIQDSCQSIENFKKLLYKTSSCGYNILFLAAYNSKKENFEFIITELSKILSSNEIKNFLTTLGIFRRNLLQEAAWSSQSLEFHESLWIIIQRYFDSFEILEFVKHLDIFGNNVLTNVIKKNTKNIIELTWREIRKVIESIDILDDVNNANVEYCDLIIKKALRSENLSVEENQILRLKWMKSTRSELFDDNTQLILKQKLEIKSLDDLMLFLSDYSIKNHEIVWKNLLEVNKTCDAKVDLLIQKNSNGYNYIDLLIIYNTADVIQFTFKKLKENICENRYQVILELKGYLGRNLLQTVIVASKNLKKIQIVWKTLLDSFQSIENFKKLLEQNDSEGSNVFSLASCFASDEIFKFLIEESEKIISREEIKNNLMKYGKSKRNLLQSAVCQNKNLELHEALWSVIRKYFNSCEILRLIIETDIFGENLLSNVITKNEKNVIELTWREIKKTIKITNSEGKNINENIEKCDSVIKKVLKSDDFEIEEESILKLEWIDNGKSESLKIFNSIDLKRNIKVNTLDDLMLFMSDKNVENHTKLWENLLKVHKSNVKLKQLLLKKDNSRNNFIHLLLLYNNANVIEFTFKKLKENLSELHYKEVLRSTGSNKRNLIQLLASTKEVETIEIVWKTLSDSCETIDKFKEILIKEDKNRLNTFTLAATFATDKIFKYILEKYEEIIPHDKIKDMLTNLNSSQQNLLQTATCNQKSLQFHETLWEIIKKYFDSFELLQFVKHLDIYKDNLLVIVIEETSNIVIEFTWNEVKNVLNALGVLNEEQTEKIKQCEKIIADFQKGFELKNDDFKILKMKWIANIKTIDLFIDNAHLIINKGFFIKTLNDLTPFMSHEDIHNHEMLWKHLEENFQHYPKLRKLLMEKNESGDSFIHLVVAYNTSEVIEFTIQNFKKHLSSDHYTEILLSKGERNKGLLHRAISSSEEIRTHEFLWKTIQNLSISNKEFLNVLRARDDDGENIFHSAVIYSKAETIMFIEEQLEKIASVDEVKQLLTNLDSWKDNILQSVVRLNTSLEANKTVWKIIQKYFSSIEILEFIKHLNSYDSNLILEAVYNNSAAILEFIWKEIKEFLENNKLFGKEISKNLERCDLIVNRSLKFIYPNDDEVEFLKLKWLGNDESKLFCNIVELILNNKLIITTLDELKLFMSDNNVRSHEILWESLLKTHNKCEHLVALLSQKDMDEGCFVHLIVEFNKSNVIEFTLKQLKENLCEFHFKKVLTSKGEDGGTLLHIAAKTSKEISTFQILWKLFLDLSNSDQEFLKTIKELDDKNCNIIDIAAYNSTGEIFEFLLDEIAKIASQDEIRFFLKNLDNYKQNLLQMAATTNEYLNFHEVIWKILQKYFITSEIVEFINHFDVEGYHLLHCAVIFNSIEIVEFLWAKIIFFITEKDDQINYLEKVTNKEENIVELSEKNALDDEKVVLWVKDIIRVYEINFSR